MKTLTICTTILLLCVASLSAESLVIEILEGDIDNYHAGDAADVPSFQSDAVIASLAPRIPTSRGTPVNGADTSRT